MVPSTRPSARAAAILVAALALAMPSATCAVRNYSSWGTAVLEAGVNSAQADGCPIESPDGLSLYIASTRPGAVGGATDPNDIWVAKRTSKDAPFAAPQHLPAPVNSAAADFCPTPLSGKGLLLRLRSSRQWRLWCGRHLLHTQAPGPRLADTEQPRLLRDGSRAKLGGRRVQPVAGRDERGDSALLLEPRRRGTPGHLRQSDAI